MSAKRCRNSGYNLDITVTAEAFPCPMFGSADHSVKVVNTRLTEIEGFIISKVRHKFAMFDQAGRPVKRVRKHFVARDSSPGTMNKKLIQGPAGKGPETIENDVSYLDETEKDMPDIESDHIPVDYWIEVK